ncbi:MAG: hypothetical protein IKI20_09185 [Lachnospiraceae bacterium]|nr:hypothetical protein [Lachnospiraceae bacterium]
MEHFLAKMERKFGKYAIRNLPLYLIICYAFGYIMNYVKPEWIYVVNLNPHAILHGQVWRLISWILVPEDTSLIFIIIVLYFYYSIGRTLEKTWGSFLFDVYFFTGFIMTILGAFGLYIYFQTAGKDFITVFDTMNTMYSGTCPALYGGHKAYTMIANSFSTYYINLSIFLAFAITYPEVRVYIFFIIPVKVKVLGIIYVALLGVNVAMTFIGGIRTLGTELGIMLGVITLVSVGTSLLNTFLFFLYSKRGRYKSPKEIKRQHDYKVKIKAAARQTHHKCAICGRTEESNPNLAFRYCSKCNGNYEYCSEHLFSHQHVK